MRHEDIAVVLFHAIKQFVDDCVDGRFEHNVLALEVGGPATHLFKDEAGVEWKSAPGKRLFDDLELFGGEFPAGAEEPVLKEIDAELGTKWKDLQEVLLVWNVETESVQQFVLVGKSGQDEVYVWRQDFRQPGKVVSTMNCTELVKGIKKQD